jgi:para-nitrobenzyl esterase
VDGVVEIRGGRVRGVERNGVWSFSGVPYAASPAGERRWRPPVPPEPWPGVRDCDRFGPVAPQAMGFMDQALSGGAEPPRSDEDCLNLNVWTPALDGGRRPVMVWVHGGSFMTGTGSSGLYRGGRLARSEDVVVVTINYRLGLLGFLAHPALDDPGQTWFDGREWTGSGNWGLADQVAALVWVRDHIAGFGGDPGNVTLFGESAGGMSVSALLAVPAAAGLFHRAVVESGPPHTCTPEVAARRAERLAEHLGVDCTREALARVPAQQLVEAGAQYVEAGADAGLLMTPVVDGGLLASPPEEAVAGGSAASVPLLIGTNRDESAFFVVGSPKLMGLTMVGLRHWVRRITPDDEAADRVVSAVLAARGGRGESTEPRDLWSAIATEVVFRVGTARFADAHAAAASPGVGTYAYLFTWESPAFEGVLGSCHALEIPFVFGTLANPVVQAFSGGGEDAFALSAHMGRAWASFARSGVPECGWDGAGTAPWEAWDTARRPTTVLGPWPGATGLVHRIDDPRGVELDAVDAVLGPLPGHRNA